MQGRGARTFEICLGLFPILLLTTVGFMAILSNAGLLSRSIVVVFAMQLASGVYILYNAYSNRHT